MNRTTTPGGISIAAVIPSLIRTYVPVAVGQVFAWLVVVGIVPADAVTADQQATLSAVLGAVLTGVYYTLARLAETRWPKVGVLLGSTSQPVDYAEGHDVVAGEVVAARVDGAHRDDDGDGIADPVG